MSSVSSTRLQLLPPASAPGSENEGIRVKMMEKGSHELVVKNYSSLESFGMGYSISSTGFVVGGHLFTIEFYPNGWDWNSYLQHQVSLVIKNENEVGVDVVFDLHIGDPASPYCLGFSCFNDKEFYKYVTSVKAGQRFWEMEFCRKQDIRYFGCVKDDSVKIRATVGVFIDAKVGLPLERCILFKVGNQRYYGEESLITTRCPALLSHSHSQSDYILISDIDKPVFVAMLWFIYNQLIHEKDARVIANSKGSHPNSFALKILAAADRFHLKDLRTQCETFISYWEGAAHVYYTFEFEWKRLRTYGGRLWAKVKEAISQNTKES